MPLLYPRLERNKKLCLRSSKSKPKSLHQKICSRNPLQRKTRADSPSPKGRKLVQEGPYGYSFKVFHVHNSLEIEKLIYFSFGIFLRDVKALSTSEKLWRNLQPVLETESPDSSVENSSSKSSDWDPTCPWNWILERALPYQIWRLNRKPSLTMSRSGKMRIYYPLEFAKWTCALLLGALCKCKKGRIKFLLRRC